MSLNIPPEFERAILDRVASGAYETPEDVLKACLEALKAQEEEAFRFEELRREIQIGLDQYERGEYSDGEEAIARIRDRIRQR
jgi:putative addiction module CopG family antidote